jgi:hypothetical protein
MRILVLLLMAIPVISFGQVCNVDFEDSDLTGWYQNINSRWEISSKDPIEGSWSLKHAFDNDSAGLDWIAFFHQPFDLNNSDITWEFSLKYDHNPSASNNWAVFLASSDLPYTAGGIEDALILGVNYRGSDDKLALWRQHYEDVECIYSGDFNWEEKVPPGKIVSFQVAKSANGYISVNIDTAGAGYFYVGGCEDVQLFWSNSFILYYKYSQNFDQGLTFDKLRITGISEKDSVPAEITSVNVISPQSIEVSFNEIIQVSAMDEFCVDGVGCGISEAMAGRRFLINLPHKLNVGSHYSMQLPELSDMDGNLLSSENRNNIFYYPKPYDVVISEIMADPTPKVLLPGSEYVELFNRTKENIILKGWHFSANRDKCIIPEFLLGPNKYVIICDKDSASKYKSTNIEVLGIQNFPAINNEQCELILSDPSNRLVHSVSYSNNLFASTNKKEGGWSAEMIDYNNPCSNSENWGESVDFKGGTPGYFNSILQNNSNIEFPKLYRAAITDTGTLMLYFSQPMDSNSLVGPDFYFVGPEIGQPYKVLPSWPVADKVELFFDKEFKPLMKYEISLTFDLTDCNGNTFSEYQKNIFEKPVQSDTNEIQINEIMYNPAQGNVEYIELYNNSDMTVDLRNWILTVGDTSATGKIITSDYFPLLKDQYVIISKMITGAEPDYLRDCEDKIIFMADFPQLSNEGSVICLRNNHDKLIDAALFAPEFNSLLIQNPQGVSLERVSNQVSGLDPKNWQSASSDAGYMTPAAKNSQQSNTGHENFLNIEPYTITPNADGIDDELAINYKMNEPGYMGRIMVFDASGNLEYTILNGGLLGTEGRFIFGGKYENGTILNTGYHILYFDAYKQDSKRFAVKKAFIVTSMQ